MYAVQPNARVVPWLLSSCKSYTSCVDTAIPAHRRGIVEHELQLLVWADDKDSATGQRQACVSNVGWVEHAILYGKDSGISSQSNHRLSSVLH